MKKIILSVAVLSLMFVGIALATEPEDIYGCTDPISPTYNELATIDDGSCYYPSNGPLCALNGTCPCMGLIDDVERGLMFRTNCETRNAQTSVILKAGENNNGITCPWWFPAGCWLTIIK